MNAMQRGAIYATGFALACLIAAHNPMRGYTTTIARYDPWPLPSAIAVDPASPQNTLSCGTPTPAQQTTLASQKHFLGEELGHCRLVALDVWQWRSDGALLPYLATVRRAVGWAAAILIGALSWLWLFRAPQPRESSRRKSAASMKPSD